MSRAYPTELIPDLAEIKRVLDELRRCGRSARRMAVEHTTEHEIFYRNKFSNLSGGTGHMTPGEIERYCRVIAYEARKAGIDHNDLFSYA